MAEMFLLSPPGARLLLRIHQHISAGIGGAREVVCLHGGSARDQVFHDLFYRGELDPLLFAGPLSLGGIRHDDLAGIGESQKHHGVLAEGPSRGGLPAETSVFLRPVIGFDHDHISGLQMLFDLLFRTLIGKCTDVPGFDAGVIQHSGKAIHGNRHLLHDRLAVVPVPDRCAECLFLDLIPYLLRRVIFIFLFVS